MAHVCPNCGNRCSSSAKLSEWERAELKRRADRVLIEHPRRRNGTRQVHLRSLASEYGINIRTLYRYLRRAA